MTENRRIFLNIVATYGRSLFTLACGLFTGRWLLMSLGEVDYGLLSVVGALTGFIGFISSLIAGAVGRFYTYAIGEARVMGAEGLENCRKWFNTAFLLHSVIPLVMLLIGYPIGDYAIRHAWLNIPPDRVEACIWVFRFSCLSAFLGLVTVPFNAMYGAKQYIAELTVYSFITTTLNVCFLYYMVTHPGDWLARYVLWGTLLSLAPNFIIAIRAYQLFPECRFRRVYLWDWGRIKALFAYASAQSLDIFVTMLRHQGIAILVNKYLTPVHNASITVANSVTTHCYTLAGCMAGAFSPALTSACGAHDYKRMHTLAFGTCKVGILLIFIFALPMLLEVHEVMRLWLKNPPEYAPGLCSLFLIATITERFAWGHSIALNANGKLFACQGVLCAINLLLFPLAWLALALGYDVYSVGVVHILMMLGNVAVRVYFSRKLVGMGIRHWVFSVVLPLLGLAVICLAIGAVPRVLFAPSFWRVCATTLTIEVVFFPAAWFIVLSKEEREFVQGKLMAGWNKLRA